jgi:hypothetical protein
MRVAQLHELPNRGRRPNQADLRMLPLCDQQGVEAGRVEEREPFEVDLTSAPVQRRDRRYEHRRRGHVQLAAEYETPIALARREGVDVSQVVGRAGSRL